MTLVEFLRERLAEDEMFAQGARGYVPGSGQPADGKARARTMVGQQTSLFTHHFTPERMLAEVKAKQRLIERYEAAATEPLPRVRFMRGQADGNQGALLDVLRDTAEVYADHPDYRDEWRP